MVEIGDDMRAFAEILGELGVELAYIARRIIRNAWNEPEYRGEVAISLTVGLGAPTNLQFEIGDLRHSRSRKSERNRLRRR
jgi:hypothetical protein